MKLTVHHKRTTKLNTSYYQIPRIFFTSDKYRSMSMLSKVAWAAMWSRAQLSEKNGWVLDNGLVVFAYSYKNLMDDLGIRSTSTIYKVKQELKGFDLLIEHRISKRKVLYTLKIPRDQEERVSSQQSVLNILNKNIAREKDQSVKIDRRQGSEKLYNLLHRILKERPLTNVVYEASLEAHRFLEEKHNCRIPFDDQAFHLRQVIAHHVIRFKAQQPQQLDEGEQKKYWFDIFRDALQKEDLEKLLERKASPFEE